MKAKTERLIAKAQSSLAAAQSLAEQGFYDFAASRAYYTMFYIAEAFLWERNLSFSSHAAVISAFGREIARAEIVPKSFHRFLIDAQDKRTQGDYGVDEETELSAADVSVLLEQCRQFIEAADNSL